MFFPSLDLVIAEAITLVPSGSMAEDLEIIMRKLFAGLIGAVIFSTVVTSLGAPAHALGGCGPNRHRNVYGYCVFGGQNQAYCLRHTGHVAAYVGYGRHYCY